MRFPKDGTKEDVQAWFSDFDDGVFREFGEKFQRYGGTHVFGLSSAALEKALGALDGEALYNAIHKHDRPAATTSATAATGRLRCRSLG